MAWSSAPYSLSNLQNSIHWLRIVNFVITNQRLFNVRYLFREITHPHLNIINFTSVFRENIASDILQGCAVVTLTLLAFIGLVWLREQILHGGGPEWLEMEPGGINVEVQQLPPQQQGPVQGPQPQQELQGLAAVQPADDDPPGGVADNLPAEPAPPEILENQNNQNNELNLGDDGQWNPMEWDRAAEELTWERLLGMHCGILKNFLPLRFYVKSRLFVYVTIS